jgi:hypothetical protein
MKVACTVDRIWYKAGMSPTTGTFYRGYLYLRVLSMVLDIDHIYNKGSGDVTCRMKRGVDLLSLVATYNDMLFLLVCSSDHHDV